MTKKGIIWVMGALGICVLIVQVYAYTLKRQALNMSYAEVSKNQEIMYQVLVLENYDGLLNLIFVLAAMICILTGWKLEATRTWIRVLVGVLLAIGFVVIEMLVNQWYF